ncbi:MAG TPA: methyltransferase domain-containing protein [Terracidiphilus sp.]|jgi:SAM-dependent methyltransferase|nr:methyltransferase domain-containing protein [Terracidiphilus sp.]
MQPELLDFHARAQLTELMDEPCSREDMRACLIDLAKLNRWFLGYRPILRWLDAFLPLKHDAPIRILDVGCGGGDSLRRVARWAADRRIEIQLVGLDLNADAVSIAEEFSNPSQNIEWVCCDVFDYQPPKPFHIVMSSLFTHHLRDQAIVRFLGWMESHASLGWLINDLSRAPVPYHLLKAFSRVAGLHRFVQHDGPVSIARAFVREDWQHLCGAAGLSAGDVTISSYTPARLCVMRQRAR